jgi:hypothetical protein
VIAATDGGELRITFRQHDGEMLGTCWCGRTSTSSHPRQLWEWLDEHEHEHATAADPEERSDD